MKDCKSRMFAPRVLALSLLVFVTVQGGGWLKSAEASVGAWSIVSSPNPSSSNNYLYGVSLANATNVWAVGSYFNSAYRTLALKWDGTSWTQETTPNPILGNNELYGVHARSANDVWAVGNSTGPASPQPIILRRTPFSSGWASFSVPYTPGHSMYLRGVSAVNSNLAWAVGFDGFSPLIYKWDGTSWSIDSLPFDLTAQLRAVSAASANDVWAVGSTGPGNTGDTVTLHWDGTKWSRITSPNPGTTNNGLAGVKTISSTLAYAVGYYNSGSGQRTLALRWDGSAWNTETSDSPDTTDQLEAVDAGGTQTWSVGESRTAPFRTLTLRRNSSTLKWNAISSPNNNSNNHFLHGVTVDPAITGCGGGDIWAVGHYDTGSGFNTLIMQYTVAAPCG